MFLRRKGIWVSGAAVAIAVGFLTLRIVSGARVQHGPLNVIIILIDTLRADHVGCYGYPRATTPNLDRFAGTGVQFRNAYSVSSWTLPAVASLFTGLLPHRHGAASPASLLPDTSVTLAKLLKEDGYETAAISANFAFIKPGDAFPAPPLHFGQGFDTFQLLWQVTNAADTESALVLGEPVRTVHAEKVGAKMQEFLSGATEPFFLFAAYMDPHYGYEPPPGYGTLFEPKQSHSKVTGSTKDLMQLADPLVAEDLAHLRNLYDSDIRYADEVIGDFLAALDESGMADRTLVVVLSDHGEEFAEHGKMLHAQDLYEESVRIALLVRGPGIPRGVVVDEPASIMDVMPTVLRLTGVSVPAKLDGRSLAASWRHQIWSLLWKKAHQRDFVFELDNEEVSLNGHRTHSRAMIHDRWKIITLLDDKAELYDLANDPGEKHNLVETEPAVVSRLRQVLAHDSPKPSEPAAHQPLTAAYRERLRALGYELSDE